MRIDRANADTEGRAIEAPWAKGLLGLASLVLVAAFSPRAAHAAEFFVYLKCQGQVRADGKSTGGAVDLAMRDNNQTALVQQSTVLPVGARLKYDVSPATYSMTYRVPGHRTALVYDWWRGSLFVWHPNLKTATAVRLSIDRQSGRLTGEMLNAVQERLATLDMTCEPLKEEDLAPPKF